MDVKTIAVIAQEIGRITSEVIRVMPLRTKKPEVTPPETAIEKEELPESFEVQTISIEKATSIKTGCIPCAIGHLGTCSGLLNESTRFARDEGISSTEVINRMNICLDELNSMERVDLRPEMISNLPDWEKKLAESALNESRQIRHRLEGIKSTTDLEKVAAETQTVRNQIGTNWFQEKLSRKEKTNES